MMIISSLYRKSLAFSFELAKESEKKVEKIKNALKPAWGNIKNEKEKQKIIEKTKIFFDDFIKNMNDDFNTPIVLREIFIFTKYINSLKDIGVSKDLVSIAQNKLMF